MSSTTGSETLTSPDENSSNKRKRRPPPLDNQSGWRHPWSVELERAKARQMQQQQQQQYLIAPTIPGNTSATISLADRRSSRMTAAGANPSDPASAAASFSANAGTNNRSTAYGFHHESLMAATAGAASSSIIFVAGDPHRYQHGSNSPSSSAGSSEVLAGPAPTPSSALAQQLFSTSLVSPNYNRRVRARLYS